MADLHPFHDDTRVDCNKDATQNVKECEATSKCGHGGKDSNIPSRDIDGDNNEGVAVGKLLHGDMHGHEGEENEQGGRLASAQEARLHEWPQKPGMDSHEFRYGSQIRRLLYARQHPPNCSHSKFVLGQRAGGSGFGSRIWYYRMCLTKAFAVGAVYVQPWGDRSRKDDSHSRSWTNCTIDDTYTSKRALGNSSVMICRWPDDHWRWLNTIPSPYERFGLLWWQTQVTWYLLRPAEEVLNMMNASFLEWGLSRLG